MRKSWLGLYVLVVLALSASCAEGRAYNAALIMGREVDSADPADGALLQYESTDGKVYWAPASTALSPLIINTLGSDVASLSSVGAYLRIDDNLSITGNVSLDANRTISTQSGYLVIQPTTSTYLRGGGVYQVYINDHAGAGNTILNTVSGNVGIGTTSPYSTAKLDVRGQAEVTGNVSLSGTLTAGGRVTGGQHSAPLGGEDDVAFGSSGDTNTGMYFPAIDRVRLVAGAATRIDGDTTSTTVTQLNAVISSTNVNFRVNSGHLECSLDNGATWKQLDN